MHTTDTLNSFPTASRDAIETRSKIAEMYKAAHDETLYYRQLEEIVSADAGAGSERTGRTRTLAARSALVSQAALWKFRRREAAATLRDQPAGQEAAHGCNDCALTRLVDYGNRRRDGGSDLLHGRDLLNFSRSLLESERPNDLKPEDLEEFKTASMRRHFRSRKSHQRTREEHGIIAHRRLQLLDRESLSRLTELIAGPLTRTRDEQRFSRRDRQSSAGIIASQVSKPPKSAGAITQGAGFTDQMRADYQSAVAMLKQERYEPGHCLAA